MESRPALFAALRTHKRWADAASLVSIVLVVALLSIVGYLADATQADAPTRTGMYVAMVGIVVVVCIWQAAAFVAATIERLLRQRDERGPWEDK